MKQKNVSHSWVIPAPRVAQIKRMALARNNKPSEISRRRSNKWKGIDLDMMGLMGEEAVAAYYGLELQGVLPGGDAGYDLEYGKVKIAVKYRHRKDGHLLVEHREGDDPFYDIRGAHILFLTTGSCSPKDCHCREELSDLGDKSLVVHLQGWLPCAVFKAICKEADWGLGLRYFVPQGELLAPEALLWKARDWVEWESA